MSFEGGFYNSIDGDRHYDSLSFSKMFEGINQDGIFITCSEGFAVIPGGGLSVIVKPGKAWFKRTWNVLDEPFEIQIYPYWSATDEYSQYGICLSVDSARRTNQISLLATMNGKFNITDFGSDQLPLAIITIPKDSTEIKKSHIQSLLGRTTTPLIIGMLQSITFDKKIPEWESVFLKYFNNLKQEVTPENIAKYSELTEYVVTKAEALLPSIQSMVNDVLDIYENHTFVKLITYEDSRSGSIPVTNRYADGLITVYALGGCGSGAPGGNGGKGADGNAGEVGSPGTCPTVSTNGNFPPTVDIIGGTGGAGGAGGGAGGGGGGGGGGSAAKLESVTYNFRVGDIITYSIGLANYPTIVSVGASEMLRSAGGFTGVRGGDGGNGTSTSGGSGGYAGGTFGKAGTKGGVGNVSTGGKGSAGVSVTIDCYVDIQGGKIPVTRGPANGGAGGIGASPSMGGSGGSGGARDTVSLVIDGKTIITRYGGAGGNGGAGGAGGAGGGGGGGGGAQGVYLNVDYSGEVVGRTDLLSLRGSGGSGGYSGSNSDGATNGTAGGRPDINVGSISSFYFSKGGNGGSGGSGSAGSAGSPGESGSNGFIALVYKLKPIHNYD